MSRSRIVALLASLGILCTASSALAWTGPTQGPPDGNQPTPVNIGSAFQDKTGSVWFDGGIGINNGSPLCMGSSCVTSWAQVIQQNGGASPWITASSTIYYNGGNVGIGTANPTGILSINAGASNAVVFGQDAGDGRYNRFSLNGTLADPGSLGLMGGKTGDANLYIDAPSAGVLVLRPNGTTNGAESPNTVTVSGTQTTFLNGNVGIGTSTPWAPLAIKQSNNAYGLIDSDGTTDVAMGTDGSGNGFVGTRTFNGFRLITNNNTGLFVNAAGNVGIGTGTTNPGATLGVTGSVLVNGTIMTQQYCIGQPGNSQTNFAGSESCITSWPSGSSGTIGGSGTAGTIARFSTNGTTLGNSTITDNGTSATASGNVFVGGYLYDNFNTSYYLRPSGTSNLNVLYVNGLTDNGASTFTGAATFAQGPYTNDWFRVNGGNGIYWQSYGGGWYMSDGVWLRTYPQNGSTGIWANNGNIGTNGGITVGYGGSNSPTGGAIFAGNVGIGTSNPGSTLDVNGTVTSQQYCIGSSCITSWPSGSGSPSDVRLKKDITPLTGNLATLLKLQPVSYQWKDTNRGTGPQIGFIAQEVQKVLPELVHTDASSTIESLDYSRFAPVVVGAVQELNQKIDAQQKEIDELKVEIDALKK